MSFLKRLFVKRVTTESYILLKSFTSALPLRSFLSLFMLAFLLISGSVYAEPRWVTDDFEIMLRSGKSNKQRILLQLKSGTRLEELEMDEESGYTKVRTSAGEEGWVLTRYLRRSPTAKLQLPEAQNRLAKAESQNKTLRAEIDGLKKDKQTLQREVADLQTSNTSLQEQVERITRLSAGTIQVDDENQQLKQQLAENERQIGTLQADNLQLSSRANREWFMVGGAVLVLGILLGLILPRLSYKKKSSWSDF